MKEDDGLGACGDGDWFYDVRADYRTANKGKRHFHVFVAVSESMKMPKRTKGCTIHVAFQPEVKDSFAMRAVLFLATTSNMAPWYDPQPERSCDPVHKVQDFPSSLSLDLS